MALSLLSFPRHRLLDEQRAATRGRRWFEIEKLAGAGGADFGFRISDFGIPGQGQVNHRLGQVFVARDVPIWVVLFGEGFEADGLQLVEGGETLARGVFVAGVAEGAEDVGVLVARQAVGVGHHGVNGGADGPAGVFARQHGPGVNAVPASRHASPNCSLHNGA